MKQEQMEAAVDKAVLDKSIEWLEANEAAVRQGKIDWPTFCAERRRLEALHAKALSEVCIRIARARAGGAS